MKIRIDNVITIDTPSDEIRAYCRNNLVLDNPDYITKERMGKWLGNTPRYLYLYEKNGDKLIVPYGCKKSILALSKNATKEWAEYPDINHFKVAYNSDIELFEYQEKAATAMLTAKHGVIVMPCGSGKTQTALECVARLGLKTLWLTHTQDLLNQSKERAISCFDCDSSMFGVITSGKVNIGKGITFATVQTMCKLDLQRYRTEWAVIIVDECQHCAGTPTQLTQFYRVVNNLYAPYKFGLTATPDRSDNLEKSIYSLLGDKIIEISKDEVKQTTCPVKINAIDTEFVPDPDAILNGDGTINYAKLASEITEDPRRFDYVSSIINQECKQYTMVLANRVQYLKNLQEAYTGKSICISTGSNSKKAKEQRKQALKALNSGEIDCVFATYKLAAEGLDCPNLRYVVFATPEKNKRTVIQAVGRVARCAEGKDYGTVIDFVDTFGMYQKWWRIRKSYYKKLGCVGN